MFFKIDSSNFISTSLKASSSNKILKLLSKARANIILCLSPPDKLFSSGLINVSNLSGLFFTISSILHK